LAGVSVTSYLDLADYCLIAEAVTGISANVLSRMSRVISMASSALYAPQSSHEGTEFYPTMEEKAAVLCARLIANHPLPDGNKRTAFLCMVEFLARNGLLWEPGRDADDEIVQALVGLATHSLDESAFIDWIRERIAPFSSASSEKELVSEGWDAFKSQDYEAASLIFQQVTARFPSRTAFTDMAFVLLALVQVDNARLALRQAEQSSASVRGSEVRIEALSATCNFLARDYARAQRDFADILNGSAFPRRSCRIYALNFDSIYPMKVSSKSQWVAVAALNAGWCSLRLVEALQPSPPSQNKGSIDFAEFRGTVKEDAWRFLTQAQTAAFPSRTSSDHMSFAEARRWLKWSLEKLG
jgi:death on curing protein